MAYLWQQVTTSPRRNFILGKIEVFSEYYNNVNMPLIFYVFSLKLHSLNVGERPKMKYTFRYLYLFFRSEVLLQIWSGTTSPDKTKFHKFHVMLKLKCGMLELLLLLLLLLESHNPSLPTWTTTIVIITPISHTLGLLIMDDWFPGQKHHSDKINNNREMYTACLVSDRSLYTVKAITYLEIMRE